MSLANIVIQGTAGHLMSDSGWFNRDGTIARLMPKVLTFPEYRLAITGRGQHDILAGMLQEIRHFAARHGSATGRDVIGSFSELYAAACMVQGVPSRGRENACDVQLVWYDAERQRATGGLIANIVDDHPGLSPFMLQPVLCSFTGDIDPDSPLGAPADVTNPAAFDVRCDGRKVAARQRARPWALPGYPEAYYVAGAVHLATVSADGVRVEVLCEWPDKVGERINPELAPV